MGATGACDSIYVRQGYVAGDSISSSATWYNTTIRGLGLTPGTYTWTWGSGGNADSYEVVVPSDPPGPAIAAPEHSTLTLLGIGAVCSLGYWRRRR